MDKEELISVIVPVYNVQNYICRCLDTIINQTYKNIEIILVDDGSKDESGKICEEYAKKDSRIRVIHKENEGLGLTRNVGIKYAMGKYIAFIDSDDFIELNMYEIMYKKIKENDLDAVLCNYKRLKKDKTYIYNVSNFDNKQYSCDEIQKDILLSICGNPKYKTVIGSVCCVLYKKDIIDKYNIKFLNEREYVSEDIIFNYMYFSKCRRIQLLRDNMYIYCENEGSLTKKYNPAKIDKFINLYNFMKKQVETYKEETCIGLDTLYIGYMRVAIIQEITLNTNKKNIKNNIKKICNDELLCEILKRYKLKNLKIKQTIFTILMKYKLVNLIVLTVKLVKN